MAKDSAIVVSRHSRSDLDIVGNKLRRCFRLTDDGGDFDHLLARLDGVDDRQNTNNDNSEAVLSSDTHRRAFTE